MMECSETNLFSTEKEKKIWADYLLIYGMIIYSIAGNFSISASQIGLSLALIGLITLVKKGEIFPRRTPMDIPFACFALAGILSLFYAQELLRAIVEMKKFLIILVFYIGFWPRMTESFQRKILAVFISTATLISLVGIIKLKFFDIHLDRVYGFFSLPITFGECQAMAALVVITWFCADKHSKKTYLLLAISLVCIISSLIMSYTRGAWIGFLFGFLSLIVRFPKKLLPVSVILALVLAIAASNVPMFRERLESMSISENLKAFNTKKVEAQDGTGNIEAAIGSSFRRLRNWQLGFTIVKQFPIFGVGMNNVKHWYIKKATKFERENNFIFGHQHSDYMQVLVMTGLFGLTIFFWFIVSTAKFLIESSDTIDGGWQEKISRGGIAIFFCFLATGLTEYSWGDEEVAMLAFFLMGVISNPVVIDKKSESPI